MKNYDILDVQEMIKQGNAAILESLNNTIAQAIEKSNVQVEDKNALTNKDVSALMSFLKSHDRQMGIGTKESRSNLDNIEKEIRESIEGGFTVGLDAFRAKMDQEYNKMIMKSQKGKDGPLNFESAKAKSNDEAKSLKKEYSKDLSKENEKIIDKILGFFKGKEASDDEKGKKNRKNFIADFIEELGKAPTLAGALMDLVKLVTYVGATYLKKFGTLGRIIGAALVIFGPTLAGMLGKAILGGLGKLSLGAMGKAGGAIGLGAIAVNEWKNGSKGAGAMFGLASAAMGAALVPALAPIAVPVAAIATGIGLIIKFHKQIGEWFKDVLKFLGIISKEDVSSSVVGTSSKAVSGIAEERAGTYGKLQIGKSGAILGMEALSPKEVSEGIQLYKEQDPTGFGRVYEGLGEKYADVSNITQDATFIDKATGKKMMLGAKGSSAMMEEIYAALIAQGEMTEEQARMLKFIGGKSTSASKHSLGKLGHTDPYARVTDMAARGWTNEQQAYALPIIKGITSKYGLATTYEAIDSSGKAIFGADPNKLGGGWFHSQLTKMTTPVGALKNIDEYSKKDDIVYVSKSTGEIIATKASELPAVEDSAKQADEEEFRKQHPILSGAADTMGIDLKSKLNTSEVVSSDIVAVSKSGLEKMVNPTSNDTYRNIQMSPTLRALYTINTFSSDQ